MGKPFHRRRFAIAELMQSWAKQFEAGGKVSPLRTERYVIQKIWENFVALFGNVVIVCFLTSKCHIGLFLTFKKSTDIFVLLGTQLATKK